MDQVLFEQQGIANHRVAVSWKPVQSTDITTQACYLVLNQHSCTPPPFI